MKYANIFGAEMRNTTPSKIKDLAVVSGCGKTNIANRRHRSTLRHIGIASLSAHGNQNTAAIIVSRGMLTIHCFRAHRIYLHDVQPVRYGTDSRKAVNSIFNRHLRYIYNSSRREIRQSGEHKDARFDLSRDVHGR